MSLDVIHQQQIFERYQAGSQEGLAFLLDLERPFLFDYLLRMTGDLNRALSTIDEAFNDVLSRSQKWPNLAQLRFDLYMRCRSISKALWHNDVGLLENQALESVLKNKESNARDMKRATAFAQLDKAINSSPPAQREVLILHLRCKFTFSDIARIMGYQREDVEGTYGEIIHYLQQEVANLPSDPRSAIAKLSPNPLPQANPDEMTDLNEFIGGLRRSQGHRLRSSLSWLLSLLLFLVLLAAFMIYRRPALIGVLQGYLHHFTLKILALIN